MKQKKKRKLVVILAVAGAFILAIGAAVLLNMPKKMQVSNTTYDLNSIADGLYLGSCENGLVKAEVEVEVQNHAIASIKILKHDNGLGSGAEVIIDTVVEQQSIELDAVAGATYSSGTILKAVEDALSKG